MCRNEASDYSFIECVNQGLNTLNKELLPFIEDLSQT